VAVVAVLRLLVLVLAGVLVVVVVTELVLVVPGLPDKETMVV
jgi:hypothetical protein